MRKLTNKPKESISGIFILAKIIAVLSGILFSSGLLYFYFHPLPYSNKPLAEYSLLEWLFFGLIICVGPACILAAFINHKFPTLAAWLLIVPGLGIFFILFVIMIGLLGIPMIAAGFLTLSAEDDRFQRDKRPTKQQ